MGLKTAIETFYNERNVIKTRISAEESSEVLEQVGEKIFGAGKRFDKVLSDAFKPVAEQILSGYFKVTNNRDSSSYVKVHPTCVEIYYHEEGPGNDKVKDYIVYHRDSVDGTKKKSVFPLGLLHNHVSGIDITFEKLTEGLPVRFSALIREFWVDKSNKKEVENDNYGDPIKPCTEAEPETRSTYLYEALYSQYSVFDGFSVQWVDDEENLEKIRKVKERLNVAEYRLNEKNKPEKQTEGEPRTRNNKYKQCLRMWSYSINEDKNKQ